MPVTDGPGEGTWSVFACRVVEERDMAIEELKICQALLKRAYPYVMNAPWDRPRDELLKAMWRRF